MEKLQKKSPLQIFQKRLSGNKICGCKEIKGAVIVSWFFHEFLVPSRGMNGLLQDGKYSLFTPLCAEVQMWIGFSNWIILIIIYFFVIHTRDVCVNCLSLCICWEKGARNKQSWKGRSLVQTQGVAWLVLFSMVKEIDRQQEKNEWPGPCQDRLDQSFS